MNVQEEKVTTMDLQPQPSEHFCYVRCNFCNTVLAVGIPCKRLLDTVTVKCGHCSNLSFLSTRPPPTTTSHHHHHNNNNNQNPNNNIDHTLTLQGFYGDLKKGGGSSSSSPSSSFSTTTSSSTDPVSPKAPPFVVKPPEKKHRLPSAYNRFMKEEIQRIKAANPEIPHREAFSAAAKNNLARETERADSAATAYRCGSHEKEKRKDDGGAEYMQLNHELQPFQGHQKPMN
ncbi:protein CRABS CLAW [Senna tora]|uniref:Protein CRABS CLAW n=1 Tax=Senna tora TaxID=362788 RepID=A0A834TUZ4_9FABA|nr:protein CRABS CLAW [Senna tora]